MKTFLIASLTLALVLTVVALVHQVRLRRALERLLRLILYRWRTYEDKHNTPKSDSAPHGRDSRDRL